MSVAGVISLTIQSAHLTLPWSILRGGSPDLFVSISINGGPEVGKTSYRPHDPSWMETIFVSICSLDDTLTLTLFDRYEHRKHTLLGVSTYKLSKLREDKAQGGLLLPLLKSEKTRGELLIDLIYYPLMRTNDCDSKNLSAGVVSLTLPQARNLDASGSRSGHLSSLAKVCLGYYDDVPILITNRCKHTLNPMWLAQHDFYCARKDTCIINVQVIDDHLDDPVVGHLSLWLDDLLDGNKTGVEWWPMSGCSTGEVMIRAVWRPVDLNNY